MKIKSLEEHLAEIHRNSSQNMRQITEKERIDLLELLLKLQEVQVTICEFCYGDNWHEHDSPITNLVPCIAEAIEKVKELKEIPEN